MVKYLSFHNSSFALRWFLILMARPQCDTILVKSWSKIAQISLLEQQGDLLSSKNRFLYCEFRQ
jgi:hypothetical protein